ncbi:MAG: hypothetical protein GX267_16390 [Fibrobacter sp.]|jgi:uncharacterized repeat protein (TIGR04138 family)|nr:hypothetical protein [Fibrobacter sp.]
MASTQTLDRIRRELIDSGKDTRYKTGAYEFVLNGLDFYLTQIGEKRHVNGTELSMALLNFAFKQYGLLSLDVLNYWGIKKTDDFGNIVFNMISIGLMSKQPEDKVEDFYDVFDIPQFFKEKQYFEIDKNYIKSTKGA